MYTVPYIGRHQGRPSIYRLVVCSNANLRICGIPSPGFLFPRRAWA